MLLIKCKAKMKMTLIKYDYVNLGVLDLLAQSSNYSVELQLIHEDIFILIVSF